MAATPASTRQPATGLKQVVRRKVRSLLTDKVVPGYFTNLVGVQIARVLAARTVLKFRRLFLGGKRNGEVRTLLRSGLVMIPNFLSESEYERVRREFQENFANGKNVYSTAERPGVRKIGFRGKQVPPATKAMLLRHPQVKALFAYGEGRKFDLSGCVFEECSFDDERDPQQSMHRDNFYSTHKAFFYVDDVREGDGPFVYVKGSNRLSLLRILHEYLNGLAGSRTKTLRFDHHRGRVIRWIEASLRKREFHAMAPKNTLVITDTFGYHRRGDQSQGGQRKLIRFHPYFNPFLNYREPEGDVLEG